jgi:hypothetical protein
MRPLAASRRVHYKICISKLANRDRKLWQMRLFLRRSWAQGEKIMQLRARDKSLINLAIRD